MKEENSQKRSAKFIQVAGFLVIVSVIGVGFNYWLSAVGQGSPRIASSSFSPDLRMVRKAKRLAPMERTSGANSSFHVSSSQFLEKSETVTYTPTTLFKKVYLNAVELGRRHSLSFIGGNGEHVITYPGGALQARIPYMSHRLHGKIQWLDPSGQVMDESHWENGLLVEIFGSGKLRTDQIILYHSGGGTAYKLNFLEGKLEGVVDHYDLSSGRLVKKDSFSKGLLHGTSREFYPDGSAKFEWDYQGGLKLSYRQFFPSGSLKLEVSYKDGKAHGVSRAYAEEGRLINEFTYDQGVLVSRKSYEK